MESEFKVNPFQHKLNMSLVQWMKTVFCGMILIPIRLIFLIFFLVIISAITWVSLKLFDKGGNRIDVENPQPPTSNRKSAISVIAFLFRICYRVSGFSVQVNGKLAPLEEAPILIAVPHSTIFDFLLWWWCCTFTNPIISPPYAISRIENLDIPLYGNLMKLCGCINVDRKDPSSRKKTAQEIIRRCEETNSSSQWPKLLITPEGTHGNRKAILPFKAGAFNPGKPIQPILISYPNKLDTVTWTWDQKHGLLAVILLTLAQPWTNVLLDFLPVYKPNSYEKEDAMLYSKNVRNFVANKLKVPVSDIDLLGQRNTSIKEPEQSSKVQSTNLIWSAKKVLNQRPEQHTNASKVPVSGIYLSTEKNAPNKEPEQSPRVQITNLNLSEEKEVINKERVPEEKRKSIEESDQFHKVPISDLNIFEEKTTRKRKI